MLVRLLSLVLLLAVLPTVELGEQLAHVIEHALEGEAAGHSAHHEQHPADEHGCTGLVHLCGAHHAQVDVAHRPAAPSITESLDTLAPRVPGTLSDLHALEPPHRPPIG